MEGLPLVDPEASDGETAELLAAAQEVLGITANITKAVANSPAALKGYLSWLVALRDGTLSPATRQRIALLVAQENECDYCLSAHTYLSTKLVGLSPAEADQARRGSAATATAAAELALATVLIRNRGSVIEDDLAAARKDGLSNAAIIEVIAQIALSVFTTYLAKAGRVENDWPLVRHTD